MKGRTNLRRVLGAALTLGLYVCAANLAHANLITNGDFQSENTGFGSDYTFGGDGNGNVALTGIGFTKKTYEILDTPTTRSAGPLAVVPAAAAMR